MNPSLYFFLPEREYMELELRSVEHQGARETGGAPKGEGAPPPSWTGCGPPDTDSFVNIFLLFSKRVSVDFQVISRTFISAQK